MKVCTICKELKPLSAFYNNIRKVDGKSYRCKSCDDKARRKWSETNPERAKRSQRERNLKHRFGITLEQFEEMLTEQGGGCAICGSTKPKNTGRLRGLLCNDCNRGIGLLGDTPEVLGRAYKYIIGETKR